MTKPTDLVQGTLDLLILRTIATEQLHGWAIAQRIQILSNDVLQVNQGSLYPALQRLEKDGLVASEWGTTDNNRRARYYRITPRGRRMLGEELDAWRRFSAGLEAVLRAT